MALRDILSTANRGIGRVMTISFQIDPLAITVSIHVRMTEVQRANVLNGFDFDVYGSTDNFVSRTYLGGTKGWTGGTEIDKATGLLVTKGPPGIILEVSPSLKEMLILIEINCLNAVRFGCDGEDR